MSTSPRSWPVTSARSGKEGGTLVAARGVGRVGGAGVGELMERLAHVAHGNPDFASHTAHHAWEPNPSPTSRGSLNFHLKGPSLPLLSCRLTSLLGWVGPWQ